MYETESNHRTELLDPAFLTPVAGFGTLRGKVLARTVLPWSEHCTECVWPTCYTTCDLYSPREDGRCRRFIDGMVRIETPLSLNGYLLKIRFKQWGKLWTPGNLHLRTVPQATRLETRDVRLGTLIQEAPLPKPVRDLLIGKRYSWKKRVAARPSESLEEPTAFLVECYNPSPVAISLSLTMRSARKEGRIPFQHLATLVPGINLVRISFAEIANVLNLNEPFNVELIPNNTVGETTLYFGLMEFVQELAPPSLTGGRVKCVVWDLDNTLWDGVLVEDGPATLQLKPGMIEILNTLDQRGILQSIASKNSADQILPLLERFKISHYFLYPQISWAPKGTSIQTIARCLNLSVESLLFVDDSAFERQQVASSCAGVRVLDALEYLTLLERPECQVPVTAEGKDRRKMYEVERERTDSAASFKEDYFSFLRHCEIRIRLTSLTEETLERVHELTQRTNQMNFSGTRYERDLLRDIMETPHLDTYVLSCEDRFGTYGIVGFGIVDRREPRLTDLMFSCRIQSKRIEHAFLVYIIEAYRCANDRAFYANYRKTPRNEPSGKVFADIGMSEIEEVAGLTSLVFPRTQELPSDGIITIDREETRDFAGRCL